MCLPAPADVCWHLQPRARQRRAVRETSSLLMPPVPAPAAGAPAPVAAAPPAPSAVAAAEQQLGGGPKFTLDDAESKQP